MPNSIQSIGDESVIINDSDLLILLGMMIDKINDGSTRFEALKDASNSWNLNRQSYGPGTLDLGIETVVENEKAKIALESLLAAVEQQVEGFGETIPAAEANEKWSVRGVKFSDCQSSGITLASQKLRSLLQGAAAAD